MLTELAGIVCRCRAVKKPAQSFCRGCFLALTADERKALYRHIDRGYQEAYMIAVYHLVKVNRFSLPLWMNPETEA